jgi:fructuronate reductase
LTEQLSNAALANLPSGVDRPAYDRSKVSIGIVHFGPGAFHRAHQAAYVDAVLGSDPRWGICEVALQSTGTRDALQPQDGLYTLAILDEEIGYRVIGSTLEYLVAKEDPQAVLARLADPAVRIVTSTVTEKGYCLAADGTLDMQHADILADLASPASPRSVIGYIVEGLRRRREAGLGPLTVITCDNLADNGHKLGAAVVRLARERDADLADWIQAEVAFPRTMVDSITPATDDALRDRVQEATGVADAWPIQREAFTQWVIEHDPRSQGPDWAAVGVSVTDDVGAFERCKLRLLNGAHSSLAYLGWLRGRETVLDAMNDAELAAFARALMFEDVMPTLEAPSGLDLNAYAEAILKRFRNPAIRHLLAQIAWDGSQKLPIRILGTVQDLLAQDRAIDRPAATIAAWIRFVRRKSVTGETITDPLGERLSELGRSLSDDASDVGRFLPLDAVFPKALAEDERFVDAVTRAYERLLATDDGRK